MQLAEAVAIITQTLGVLGSLFALLAWLRSDIKAEIWRAENSALSRILKLEEESKETLDRLSDISAILARLEVQIESLLDDFEAIDKNPKDIRTR
jgi:seryl-tRNA(Sec) selenium transferase